MKASGVLGLEAPLGSVDLRSFTDPVAYFTTQNDPFARNRMFPVARQCKMVSTRESSVPRPRGIPGFSTQEGFMITLTINGRQQRYAGDPEMPLLWVLRDELNLKGTKFGCGMGLCGACTVHINGEPVRSCVMSAADAAGKKITTIEGISPDGSHPVLVAWEALDVPQCGYCQAGQIMSACALLAKKRTPTDADIDSAMAGNICRCGTYGRIRAAIHTASETMKSGATKR